MPASPPRRLNLLDGMILVAGVAGGISLTRWFYLAAMHNNQFMVPGWMTTVEVVWWYAAAGLGYAVVWLAVASPTWLLVRFRRTRGRRARAWRRPGTWAGAVASLTTLALATALIPAYREAGADDPLLTSVVAGSRWLVANQLVRDLGVVVALTTGLGWFVLARARWWRPERGAIDRIGRGLGIAWIVVGAAMIGMRSYEVAVNIRSNVELQRLAAQQGVLEAQQATLTAEKAQIEATRTRWEYRDDRAKLEAALRCDAAGMKAYLEDLRRRLDEAEAEFEAEQLPHPIAPLVPVPAARPGPSNPPPPGPLVPMKPSLPQPTDPTAPPPA